MKLKITVTLASALFTLNAFAAPNTFPAQIVSSDYALNKGVSGAVSWTPTLENFSFDILGTPAYATVTNFYTPGSYSTLANSDPFSPPTTISWAVNTGQIGFEGVFSFNGYETDFVMVWDVLPIGNAADPYVPGYYQPGVYVEAHWEPGYCTGGYCEPGYYVEGYNEPGYNVLGHYASGTSYIAADVDGDGRKGFTLVNGGFQGFNFAMNTTITAVPEPETWGLMLSGLAFIGWAARRRNQ